MTENQLRYLAHQENVRHNLATEGISTGTLNETVRSNLAREGETERSNIARETETRRSNLAREIETARANAATERERERSNRANELIAAATERERERSNRANEQIAKSKVVADTVVGGVAKMIDAITPG